MKPSSSKRAVTTIQSNRQKVTLGRGPLVYAVAFLCFAAWASCDGSGGSNSGSSGASVPASGDNFEAFYTSLVCPHYLSCCSEQNPAWLNASCADEVTRGIQRHWVQALSIPRSYNRAAAQECIDLTLQILDHCRTDTATEYRKKHVCDLVFAPHWAGKGENCDLQFVPCNNLGTQRLDCGGASSGGLVCRAPVPAKIGESCDALNDS